MGFDIADFLSKLIIYMVVWIFSVSAHEFGHAWTSYKFGDDTAYNEGRVTLNPLPHIDPIGTLLLPILGFLISYSSTSNFPLIAWGKPTPVNPRKWAKYKQANVMVSIAGVLANLILLIIGFVIAKILIWQGYDIREFFGTTINPFFMLIGNMMLLNLSLFVFNLLPFPPLDGSKILSTFLPASFQPALDLLEQFGFIILMIFIYMGLFSAIIRPFLFGLIALLAA